jgi:hypothetical protein
MSQVAMLAARMIADPDLDLWKRIQHVQLGQGELGEAVQL